ncbi:MAG: nickel pincer cofactor biosynthesis protein LarC [Spirochaetaceae bacterium]|jgi:uncharacterized protein (TIGR00299 family) protein|nr:nickel pincer cofactor biosynthesis protein LarC [Spirochaetaceae bacterium]
MKTLHFDCFAGISGDMTLGALVDLGADPALLKKELSKLAPLKTGEWELDFIPDERCGITGTRGLVTLPGHHRGEHHHKDDHTPHHHGGHPADHAHFHRSWRDIRTMIAESDLTGGAKKRALGIFTLIADAEAQVHGTSPEAVTFHEVGALDSIIDIAGTAICLDMLNPERITCGEVELGGGTVRCAHGVLPVPAPATLLLVRNMPVKTGGFNCEMTTPTGAAILAASVDEFILAGSFREIKTGYGIGERKLEKPNLLRLSWREEPGPALSLKREGIIRLDTNIDDMSGEELGFLMERLFEAGALDVTLSPCVMKKSRPGTIVSVLGKSADRGVLGNCLIRHSSALGFRETAVDRFFLERKIETLRGSFGAVRQKTVSCPGAAPRSKIEFEDRARIARQRGLSLREAEKMIEAETAIETDKDHGSGSNK